MASKTPGKRRSLVNVRALRIGAMQESTAQRQPPNVSARKKASTGSVLGGGQAAWSLTGLLAAQRMTKNLKERALMKLEAKRPSDVTIVDDQVPAFASRPQEKVQVAHLKRLLEEYLAGKVGEATYEPVLAPALAKEMSEEVKRLAKPLAPPRYKLVSLVTLGERGQEDVLVGSRCLWDPYADNSASHVYQNSSLFCVASLFAIYCE